MRIARLALELLFGIAAFAIGIWMAVKYPIIDNPFNIIPQGTCLGVGLVAIICSIGRLRK